VQPGHSCIFRICFVAGIARGPLVAAKNTAMSVRNVPAVKVSSKPDARDLYG
jgi:hypothetical protein